MQLVDCLAEPVAVHEVVPIGDQVPERTTVMAERHAALHAARSLVTELEQRKRADELPMVTDAFAGDALGRIGAAELLERAELSH